MVVKVFAEDVALSSAPIRSEWVLEGAPRARNAVVAKSADRTALTMLWDCSAGRFRWVYDQDETIHVLEGSAVLTLANGRIETIGPGDVVFFPAGSVAEWRVDAYVRKLAVFREVVPAPMALVMRIAARLRALPQALPALARGWSAPMPAFDPQAV